MLDGVGVQYTLGGIGDQGKLTDSKPGKARHRLLRREALELALYSFRYLPEVSMVVTLLPPASGKERADGRDTGQGGGEKRGMKPGAQALFYRPGDLKPQLEVPLGSSRWRSGRPPSTTSRARRRSRIDSLTMSNLFEWGRAQSQDGRAYPVLTRGS